MEGRELSGKRGTSKDEQVGGKDSAEIPLEPAPEPNQQDAFNVFTQLVRNSLKSLYEQGVERERVEAAMLKFENFVANITEGTYSVREPADEQAQGGTPEPARELRPRDEEWYSSE
jgi:hypothetical protein